MINRIIKAMQLILNNLAQINLDVLVNEKMTLM